MLIKSIALFILAGLCEIGGGYLVWLWIKENKPLYYGVFGFIVLSANSTKLRAIERLASDIEG